MFYKKRVNPYSKSKLANKVLAKLRKLMIVYKKNLYYIPKLQKRVYNKSVRPRKYAFAIKFS